MKKPENSKKHSPSLIVLNSVLEKLSSCNLKIFLCISIEKREPRTIPRSRPSASTSKRTSASIFSILIHRKIFKLHLDNFSKHFVKTMREGKDHSPTVTKIFHWADKNRAFSTFRVNFWGNYWLNFPENDFLLRIVNKKNNFH